MKKIIALLCFLSFIIAGCFSDEYLNSIQENIRITNEAAIEVQIEKRKTLKERISSIEEQLVTIKDFEAKRKLTKLLHYLHEGRIDTYYQENRYRDQANRARLRLGMEHLVSE